MTPRMQQLLALAIVLVSLGQALSGQWALLAFAGTDLAFAQTAAVFALLGAVNAVVFPMVRRHLRSGGPTQWLSRAWILMSVAALFVGVLLVLVLSLIHAGGWMFGTADSTRLALIWLGGAVVVLGFGSVAWGASVGNHRIRVDRVILPLVDAPTQHCSLRIAHITDLHIGPLLPASKLPRFVERINQLEADIVVITGDLFDFDPAYVEGGCRELGRLEARLGVFAVTGNHDVYTGSDVVADGLANHTNIRLLRNDWERVDVDGAPIAIAGIEDPGDGWTERESEHSELAELASTIPSELPSLLLAHRPSYFGHAERLGFSIVLSGHTHGGQVALPRAHQLNVSRMISDHTRGIFQRGQTTLYVNRGLGMAGLPLRLNCPREIALIEFVN